MSRPFSEASSSGKNASESPAPENIDYRQTVFLPQTPFPMKGDLPKREPEWLQHWQKTGLSQKIAEKNRGKPVFLLHDGPPYANGHLHIGHALNKILKDVICRAKAMSGFDVPYIPGWDCHGLPIEWKVEETYRKQGKDKDQVPVLDFRAECRAYAAEWVKIQSEEFQRLGINGEWDNPYITMDFAAEAAIAGEIGKFLLSGELYRGLRPVMWSPVEKTALAEAEVEYHDHESQTVFVAFPLVKVTDHRLNGAKAVAWTTTPWTIPGNRALAYGEKIAYALIEAETLQEKTPSGAETLVKPGDKYLIAQALIEDFCQKTGIAGHRLLHVYHGSDLAGMMAAHPLKEEGYAFDVPLLPGEHVTVEQGTGFVHTAPSHGEEDFALGTAFGLKIPETVADDGTYFDHVPLFAGLHVYKAAAPVAAALQKAGNLVGSYKLVHSYPHSWRSKAPIIFRATPQWFIRMDGPLQIRQKALAALQKTTFIPEQGINRISSMISSRPDWCISRQRAWGVPVPVFTEKKTGEVLRDPTVVARIEAVFAKEGADAWYKRDKADFLGEKYSPDDYEQVRDIVDVWFESGSTHAFVLEKRHLPTPADLYLEGSDQHRGWFQSSLLESVGTRGQAPFKAILTHGFVMDENGRKMSKSLGNVVAPEDVIRQYGADILRLWIMNSDTAEDLRIGPEILRQQSELYRRLRNTLRWILGNLQDFSSEEAVAYEDLPDLEKFILHRLTELRHLVKEAVRTHQWTGVYPALHNFCTADLSAFYFDIRKDALYCDKKDSLTRRAALSVLDILHRSLCCFLAPVLIFTAEEAFTARFGPEKSVHTEDMPDFPALWHNKALAQKMSRLREIRRTITALLEQVRTAGKIGSSFEAEIYLSAPPEDLALLDEEAWKTLVLVSAFRFGQNTGCEDRLTSEDGQITAFFAKAPGHKCIRCRKASPFVGQSQVHPLLCERCTEAVGSVPLSAGGV